MGACFILSAIAAVWFDNFWVFLGGMAASAVILTLIDRTVRREQRLTEREASNRFLGLPDE